MKSHPSSLVGEDIRFLVPFAIIIFLIATSFIAHDLSPYPIILTALLTAFCTTILIKTKIADRFFSKHQTDDKNSKSQTADTFLFAQLIKMNCSPQRDGNDIIFHYHAGNFKAQWLDNKVIRVAYPCIYMAPSDHYSLISEIINEINADYVLVKAIAIPHSNNTDILVHVIADFYYTSDNKNSSILKEILTQCLEIQNDLFKELASSKQKPHIIAPTLNNFSLN